MRHGMVMGVAGKMREIVPQLQICRSWETGLVWRAVLAHGLNTWLDQRHAVTLGSPVVGGAPGHGLLGLPQAMESRGFSKGFTKLVDSLPRLTGCHPLK